MLSNSFLFCSPVLPERLSWVAECLRFFFGQLYPDTHIQKKTPDMPVFTFFLTGDALFSLADPEVLQIWHAILSFSSVRITCDRKELDLRGIPTGELKMKFPDQVVDTSSMGSEGRSSFWKDLASATRQSKTPLPGSAGWFQTSSPCTDRSAWYGISFLSAVLEDRTSAEFYAYLDGIHCGHHGQHPANAPSIGKNLADLNDRAVVSGLTFHALGAADSAAARGYKTWYDSRGQVISTCTIRQFRIRDLHWIIERFSQTHPILTPDSGILAFQKPPSLPPMDRAETVRASPPVTILITRHPYSTGHAEGAISFAVACAHAGILTRVLFIEDGIYAITGTHRPPENSAAVSIPEIIRMVARNDSLHFFAFMPSFQKRGVAKDKDLNAVQEIGYPGLGKILFYPPGNIQAGHQRLVIF